MNEVDNPSINVDDLMEWIREEIVRRRSSVAEPAKPATSQALPELESLKSIHLPRLNSHPQFEIKEDGYHIHDFIRFHDYAFITNAYKGLLKRPPDNEGLLHNLDRLRRGTHSKIEILGRLRYSPEGKAKKVKVKGLLVHFGAAQAYKVPVLGYLLRLGTAMIRLPAIIRNLTRFEQYVSSIHQQLQDHVNSIAGNVENGFGKHAERFVELDKRKADQLEVRSLGETIRTMEAELGQLGAAVEESMNSFQGNLADVRSSIADLDGRKAEAKDVSSQRETLSGIQDKLDNLSSVLAELEVSKAAQSEITSLNETVRSVEAQLGQLGAAVEKSMNSFQGNLADVRSSIADLDGRKAETKDVSYQRETLLGVQSKLNDIRLMMEEQNVKADDIPDELEVTGQEYLSKAIKLAKVPPELMKKFSRKEIYSYLYSKIFYVHEMVAKKQSRYLDYFDIEKAKGRCILDVGCGRGEFQEILRDKNIKSIGIETNGLEVELLKERGFTVCKADALEYLRGTGKKFYAITAFHVTEHFELDYLKLFLEHCFKKLHKNGLLILETINPHCSLGFSSFYMDETHVKPLPPEMMEFTLEWIGFKNIKILFNVPLPKDYWTPESKRNYHDYGLIAHKP